MDKPVFFVEWGSGEYPANRMALLTESGGGQYVPEAFVDSTREWVTGVDYSNAKSMVDGAMARPAKGVITGNWTLNGTTATLNVTVTNSSGVTLNTANKAAVHGIVYENYHGHKTNRNGRASGKVDITNLPDGATQDFTITLDVSNAVNLKNLVFLAVVDYKPAGGKDAGVYDQIQAAQLNPIFNVGPLEINFDFAWNEETPTAEVSLTGTSGINWTATTDRNWLIIDPSSGSINSTMNVTVDPEKLVDGLQKGTITIVSTDSMFVRKVTVNVDYEAFVAPDFKVMPTSIAYTIRQSDPPGPTAGLRITGDTPQTWVAETTNDWIVLGSTSGNVPDTLVVTFDRNKLANGVNHGSITVRDSMSYTVINVPVNITYINDELDMPYSIYLPLVIKP